MRPRRESVTILVPDPSKPGRTDPITFEHLTQRSLSSIITTTGTIGFLTARGTVSQEVEDLPEGGTVELVVPASPTDAQQVRPRMPCAVDEVP